MAYNSTEEGEKLENEQYQLIKDLTILAASMFGFSIALAAGREVNMRFVTGEFLLFMAIVSGIILLYAGMKGKEFFHYLMTKSELKLGLKQKTGGTEGFIVKAQEDLIEQYDKLLEKNKEGLIHFILKVIEIDYFYSIFLTCFLLGTFFIFISLI